MIRVLHIVSVMNYAGIETFIMNCYRHIDRSEIQFDFLVTRELTGKYDEEIITLGGRIYNLPAIKKVGYIRFKRATEKFFKAHSYNVVHCHMNTWSGFFLPIAEKYGVKIRIAHSHMAYPKYGLLEGLFKNRFKKKICAHATSLLACSNDAGKWLFGDSASFDYINDAIDAASFAYREDSRKEKRKLYGIEGKFVIGHAGRFALQKNHLFLLDILTEYLKINPDAVLLLVGGGMNNAVRQRVIGRIAELGLDDKVVIAGENPDMPEHFCAMDVFVFPSFYEGLGMALIEAQANGLFCLVSDRVPREAFATPLASPLSLELSASAWAQKIEEVRLSNKEPFRGGVMTGTVTENGFEIRDAVKKLIKYWKGDI